MSKSKIILLCGPKESGKDVLIDYLHTKAGIALNRAECKQVLHNLTQTLFGVTSERYWQIYNDRSLKEKPLPEFQVDLYHGYDNITLAEILGYPIFPQEEGELWDQRYADTREEDIGYKVNLSIREAMIYVSEVLIKPRWGKNFFGNARIKQIKELENLFVESAPITVDGSCAFVEELYPLIDYLGQENILLLRIHRDGCTYDGDSRNYIPDGVIDNTVDIDNNGSEEEYFSKVESIVRGFLNEETSDRCRLRSGIDITTG